MYRKKTLSRSHFCGTYFGNRNIYICIITKRVGTITLLRTRARPDDTASVI